MYLSWVLKIHSEFSVPTVFIHFLELTAVMCGVRICVAAYSNLHIWNT